MILALKIGLPSIFRRTLFHPQQHITFFFLKIKHSSGHWVDSIVGTVFSSQTWKPDINSLNL